MSQSSAPPGTSHIRTDRVTTVQAPADTDPRELVPPNGIIFRRVATQEEYDACVQMQYETWGPGFTEVVPATILRVTQNIGGITAGAFDTSGHLLGFVFGMTGVQDGCLVHWSDLLAVCPPARNRGLGRQLKVYQRELLRPLGVTTMYWTYDPLVARNAYLNIVRLGARPIEYVIDMYGLHTHSAVHGALGTDRFIVAWDLGAEPGTLAQVPDDCATRVPAPVVNLPQRENSRSRVVPKIAELPDSPLIRIEVPSDIQQVIAADLDLARQWRETTRRALTWYMARGYRISAFSHTKSDDRCYYTLTAPHA